MAAMSVTRDARTDRLAVNKASTRIAKKTTAVSRPAPKVYNTEPSSFRNLVQKLTGSSSPSFERQTNPPSPKPSVYNGRLQKFAPPPLNSDISPQVSAAPFKFGLFPVSPLAKSPIPLVSPGLFSPVTAFTPMEWMWSDDPYASPGSLAFRQLAQNLIDQAETSEAQSQESSLSQPSNYAISPSFRQREETSQDLNLRPQLQGSSDNVSANRSSGLSNGYLQFSPRFALSPRLYSSFNLPSAGSFGGFDLGNT
eukprot:Gb_34714 [translate_table: standard]